jgi:hypothetical protein
MSETWWCIESEPLSVGIAPFRQKRRPSYSPDGSQELARISRHIYPREDALGRIQILEESSSSKAVLAFSRHH